MSRTKPPDGPPGPTVKWVTIAREYDRQGRLVTERRTTTYDTDTKPPEPPPVGNYL
jgi:hypothetical protein